MKDLAQKALACSNEEYHAIKDAVGSSGLRTLIMQTPAHFKYNLDNPEPPSAEMRMGTYVHTAILEPHLFSSSLVVDVGSRAAKAFKDAVQSHPGKTVMLQNEFEQALNIRDAVLGNLTARNLLSQGINESSYFWTDEQTGVKCKFRPDCIRPGRIGVDLKTCADASFRGFMNSIGRFRYDMQAAFYLEGLSKVTGENHDSFTFIVAEREPPYLVACYVLDEASIERGMQDVRKALTLYAQCLDSDMWPGYPAELQPISVPHWMWGAE